MLQNSSCCDPGKMSVTHTCVLSEVFITVLLVFYVGGLSRSRRRLLISGEANITLSNVISFHMLNP